MPPVRPKSTWVNVPSARHEVRRHTDRRPDHLRRQAELERIVRDLGAPKLRRPVRLDRRRELSPRSRREVLPPAADGCERRGRKAEHRDPARRPEARNVAVQAEHRSRRATLRRVPEIVERRRLERKDELPQVLRHDRIGGNRVCGLVLLPAGKRRPVGLGEEREAEADREEGDGHGRVARVPRERERGEAEDDSAPAGKALERSKARHERAGEDHRRHEGDEPREEQEERACSALACESRGVCRAAGQRDDDHRDCAESRDVDRGHRQAAEPDGPRPDGGEEDERRDGGE